ncbi:MAG: hypothetical protein ACRD4A_08955 [Candidatus Acidiferrales bacterium]
MNIVMESEKTGKTHRYYRNKLTYVNKHLTIYGHKLTEHATTIYSRSELALEEAAEECHPFARTPAGHPRLRQGSGHAEHQATAAWRRLRKSQQKSFPPRCFTPAIEQCGDFLPC